MRLQDVQVETMRRALELYLNAAFGEDAEKKLPPIDFESCRSCEDVLAFFKDDSGAQRMRKFSLRLGNCRYPFMKLVFQELLVRDSFFFSVDTHDELDIKNSFQDYEKWLEIKRFNAHMKENVEAAWNREDIPTFASLVAEVEKQTPELETGAGEKPMVLIVEDEPDIARGVETILGRSGYSTTRVPSAERALEVLQDMRPDLILSDLEMGGMTGLDLARKLREDPDRKSIPFILATAATVGSSNFAVIDGYLVKPFDTKILLRFIAQYLRPEKS